MARNRTRGARGAQGADKRERQRAAAASGPRMPGLRWVPVPLAILLAVIGWLVFGSAMGQHALAISHAPPEQGGLSLTVNQVAWMADDMGNPGQPAIKGQFQMPQSMMPGMQAVGAKRLRVEFYLRNISDAPQRYGLADFRLLGTRNRSWAPLDNSATRLTVLSAVLDPGFQTTDDLYFDLPDSQHGRMWLEWAHGGHVMTIPVHVIGVMVGM